MADLREDFVQYVVKALVNNPDGVQLRRVSDDRGEYLELSVDSADMGKVIGKAGATAKSLRTLLRGVGTKDDLSPLPLKIVDPEGDVNAAPVADAPVAAEAVEAMAEESPEAEPAQEAAAEPVADEVPTAEPVAAQDDHQELHERTKREMEELADLEF